MQAPLLAVTPPVTLAEVLAGVVVFTRIRSLCPDSVSWFDLGKTAVPTGSFTTHE
jgi:hypothetical protein